MFPFQERIEADSGFFVDYRDVHAHIAPNLTPSRLAKIKEVAAKRDFDAAIVLENIYDRGNASAVMRSAEALGFPNVHLIEGGQRFKEANRTTAGSDKWVELKKWKSTADCVEQLRREGKKIYATHLDATAKSIFDIDWTHPCAFVLGNEHEGCSAEILAAADVRVILPMVGFVQSYNISVAGALGLFYLFQKRPKNLSEVQIRILEAVYMLRTQDSSGDVLKTLSQRGQLEFPHGKA